MTKKLLVAVLLALVVCLAIGGLVIWHRDDAAVDDRHSSSDPQDEADSPTLLAGSEAERKGGDARKTGERKSPRTSTNELSGEVVAESTGGPIEGALVVVASDSIAHVTPEAAVRTDSSGTFQIANSETSEAARLAVYARGYVPKVISLLDTDEEREPILVKMQGGGSLAGTVVDGDGAPVDGARVVCSRPANHFAWPVSESLFHTDDGAAGNWGLSNSDGTFSVCGLTSDVEYEVRAYRDGFVSSQSEQSTRRAWIGDSVRLTLLRTAEVVLRIVDAENGELIPTGNAMVNLSPGSSIYGYYAPRRSLLFGPSSLKLGEFRLPIKRDPTDGKPRQKIQLNYECWAMGYRMASGKLNARWDTHIAYEARMERLAPEGDETVSFMAAFSDGTLYEGRLELSLKRLNEKSGHFMASSVELTFAAGRATSKIKLPLGDYWVVPSGAGPEGIWWRLAGKPFNASVSATGGRGCESVIHLEGGLLDLEVVDRDGGPCRGYTLEIKYADGTGQGTFKRWDVPGHSERRTRDGKLRQSVWVGPQTGIVRATLPGVGAGEAPFQAESKGATSRIRIQLK